jgi:uncharacterized protein (DUF433 family)
MLTAIPPGLEHVMNINPEILGGEPCFNGTRVPLETVVDNLAGGHSIQEIIENYPSLTQEHIHAVLRWELGLVHQAVAVSARAS